MIVLAAGIFMFTRVNAELIYQQIYEHFYSGNHVFPNYQTWVPVGNSQVMADTSIDGANTMH